MTAEKKLFIKYTGTFNSKVGLTLRMKIMEILVMEFQKLEIFLHKNQHT